MTQIQHHFAHVMACAAENDLEPPFLGVSWDGTGYGLDGTIWGGEFLMVDRSSFYRMASLRTFPLPGGEQSIHEPRRTALAILYESFGEEIFDWDDLPCVNCFTSYEKSLLRQMLTQRISSPVSSSIGRLFDAVSSILGICQVSNFEGQAAMELEFALGDTDSPESYPFRIAGFPKNGSFSNGQLKFPKHAIDWAPMIRSILEDKRTNIPLGIISAKFHNALVEMIIAIAERASEKKVALSGGCFQNKYLIERSIDRLRDKGFFPYWHQRVPPNDGGIALGQIVAASRQIQSQKERS